MNQIRIIGIRAIAAIAAIGYTFLPGLHYNAFAEVNGELGPVLEWAVDASPYAYGQGVAVDAVGNAVIVGWYGFEARFGEGGDEVVLPDASGSYRNSFIARYFADGRLDWALAISSTNFVRAAAVSVDEIGDIYVAGRFLGTATFGAGESETTRTSAGDESLGQNDLFIARYRRDGKLEWVVTAGPTSWSDLIGLALDRDGAVIVTGGYTHAATFGREGASVELQPNGYVDGWENAFLAKYSSNSDFIWAVSVNGAYRSAGRGVAIMPDGGLAWTGFYQGTATIGDGAAAVTLSGPSNFNTFIARMTRDGELAWVRESNDVYASYPIDIAADSIGNIVVTGVFHDEATFVGGANSIKLVVEGITDVFLVKYAEDGSLVWAKRAGGGYSYGSGTAVDPDGYVLVTGVFSHSDATFGEGEQATTLAATAEHNNLFLARYTPDGGLAWVTGAKGGLMQTPSGVVSGPAGRALVVGSYNVSPLYPNPVIFGEGDNSVTLNSGGAFLGSYSTPLVAERLGCVGFEPPAAVDVVVRRPNRVLPLKMLLTSADGAIVGWDLVPPVVSIQRIGSTAGTEEEVLELQHTGRGDSGNQFQFDGEKWGFNLSTQGLAPGVYFISPISGDPENYVLDSPCRVTVAIE